MIVILHDNVIISKTLNHSHYIPSIITYIYIYICYEAMGMVSLSLRRLRGRRGGGRAPRQRPTQRRLRLLPAGREAVEVAPGFDWLVG